MLMTTVLLFAAMRRIWKWPLVLVLPVGLTFLVVDAGFFSANLLKFVDGGWVPLTLGVLLFIVMTTWREGSDRVRQAALAQAKPVAPFLAELHERKIPRVPGTGIFLTRARDAIPALIVEHVRQTGALHQRVIILNIAFEESPRVDDAERTHIQEVGGGIWRVLIRFGFVERPDLCYLLTHMKGLGEPLDLKTATFFGAHDLVARAPEPPRLPRWRLALFAFLYGNAVRFVDRFYLPPENFVEVAHLVEI
jgi:KUP system potassium uptake protein